MSIDFSSQQQQETDLNIDFNLVSPDDVTLDNFITFLLTPKCKLSSLTIKGFSRIPKSRHSPLFSVLGKNCSLIDLNLYDGKIGDNGIKLLCEALEQNSNLEFLHLNGNNITSNGALYIRKFLQSNSTLNTLSLSSNNIDDLGAEYISRSLKKNSSLTDLNLQHNKIGPIGIKHLIESLKTNSSLTFISLKGNNILNQEILVSQIATFLEKNKLKAKNYTKSLELLDSGDLPQALKYAQLSVEDQYPPATNLVAKIRQRNKDNNSSLLSLKKYQTSKLELDINHEIETIGVTNINPTFQSIARYLQDNNSLITELTVKNMQSLDEYSRSFFFNALKSNCSKKLIELNLHHNKINDATANQISQVLIHNSFLSKLILHHNLIGPTGADYICAALKVNSTLTHLDLSSNKIGPTGAKSIADMLEKNSTLSHLDLNFNNISDSGVKYIAESLKKNNSLTNLNLQGNFLQENGAKYIREALMINSTLKSLSIYGNHINSTLSIQLTTLIENNAKKAHIYTTAIQYLNSQPPNFLEALKHARYSFLQDKYPPAQNLISKICRSFTNSTPLFLGSKLQSQQVDFDFVLEDSNRDLTLLSLCQFIQTEDEQCPIKKLTLKNIHLCDEYSRQSFYTALGCNSTLSRLEISHNTLTSLDAQGINKALQNNSTLMKLVLSHNIIDINGIQYICEALTSNNSIFILDLSDNKIDSSGATILSHALQRNSTLIELFLQNNNIGDIGAEHLCKAIYINATLTKMNLEGNGISDTGAKNILDTIQNNNTLVSFPLKENNINFTLLTHISNLIQINSNKNANYTKAVEMIESDPPNVFEAIKYAQMSVSQDKFHPAKNLVQLLVKSFPNSLSDIQKLIFSLPNLDSEISFSKEKTLILQVLNKWSLIAQSLLSLTDDTQLLQQNHKVSQFFTESRNTILPTLLKLKNSPFSRYIPEITDHWFQTLNILENSFKLLEAKITSLLKDLEKVQLKNIKNFNDALIQCQSVFEKVTQSSCIRNRLLHLIQLETTTREILDKAFALLHTKTLALQELGYPIQDLSAFQEDIDSILSQIRSWKRSEEQLSKSPFVSSSLVHKVSNKQIRGGQAKVFQATYLGAPVALKEFFENVANDLDMFENLDNPIVSRRRSARNRSSKGGRETDSNTSEILDPRLKPFWKEAETFARLSHPNIVQHFGSILNPPSIILEWCPNGNLTSLILDANDLEKETIQTMNILHNCSRKTTAPPENIDKTCLYPLLPFSRVIQILEQICRGMIYLHSQKIIHFDLKPDNIMFSQNNTAKITDFGIAKQLSNTQSKTSSLKGTIPYSAPEVLLQNQQSFAVDVYSFAMLAIELISGIKPFANVPIIKAGNDKMAGKLPLWDETQSPWLEIRSDAEFRSLVHSWASPKSLERPTFNQLLEQLANTKTRASDIDHLRESAVDEFLKQLDFEEDSPVDLDLDQIMGKISSLLTDHSSDIKHHVSHSTLYLQDSVSTLQKRLLQEYQDQKHDLLSEFDLVKHAQITQLKNYAQSQLAFGLQIFFNNDTPLSQCDLNILNHPESTPAFTFKLPSKKKMKLNNFSHDFIIGIRFMWPTSSSTIVSQILSCTISKVEPLLSSLGNSPTATDDEPAFPTKLSFNAPRLVSPMLQNSSITEERGQFLAECFWSTGVHYNDSLFLKPTPKKIGATLVTLDFIVELKNPESDDPPIALNFTQQFCLYIISNSLFHKTVSKCVQAKTKYDAMPDWFKTGCGFLAGVAWSAIT